MLICLVKKWNRAELLGCPKAQLKLEQELARAYVYIFQAEFEHPVLTQDAGRETKR
jgi:hypothetical protein